MAEKKKLQFRNTRFRELTTSQWQSIEKLIEPTKRKRKIDLRQVVNAIFRVNKTGLAWRDLEGHYPAWQTVFYYFRKWQKDGTWEAILTFLREKLRLQLGREASPSMVAVDSQSVRKGPLVSSETGIDGGKNVNGRKRHIAVDSLGLPVTICVTTANVNDGQAGFDLLWRMENKAPRLSLIRADAAYLGEFSTASTYFGWKVEVTQKPPSKKGFIPQKGRWQVERSFAWLNFFRRLAKDYEKTTASAVAFIQIAFSSLILSKISF